MAQFFIDKGIITALASAGGTLLVSIITLITNALVKRFIEFIGKSKINKNTVLEYKSALMNMYKTATINAAISAINSFFAFVNKKLSHLANKKVSQL